MQFCIYIRVGLKEITWYDDFVVACKNLVALIGMINNFKGKIDTVDCCVLNVLEYWADFDQWLIFQLIRNEY